MSRYSDQRPGLSSLLGRRAPTVGLIVKMPNPSLVEQAHYLGFDLVVIDTEHGLSDGEQLEHHLRAADSVGIPTLVRVGDDSRIATLRALDAGATGVICPHVDSGRAARAAVGNAHYPPAGTRGLAASTRAGRYASTSIKEHLERSARETVVVAQIEDALAVSNAAEIAGTEGIDMVWIGPGDLSLSLGRPGETDHPLVAAAIDSVVTQVVSDNSASVCMLVHTASDMQRWAPRGVSCFFITVSDLLTPHARELVSTRNALAQFSPTKTATT